MAERRMFAKTIIDSDAFLDMPLSTQALYFHLSMRADDEGFVGNPKRIRGMIGASEDDLKLLIAKRFLLSFDSGVVVIKHWKIHNYIQSDRFKETTYIEEKSKLALDTNRSYTECIHIGNGMDTQVSIGKSKVSIDKSNIKEKNTKEKKKFVPLKGDVCSGNDQAGVESPKPDNKPPFESQRKEILPTQAVEEVESRVSTSKKESTTNQQDKDSSGMVKNFNKEECLAKLCKLYRTGRNNKTESRKNYFGYLTGTKRDRVDNRLYRYNHIQLYIAAEKYLREQREVPSDKVKLLSSYLSERVRDDVEATRNEYESEMRKHYGENWKEVRFVYD